MEQGLARASTRELTPFTAPPTAVWAAVDRIVDRSTSLEGLRAHGLDLLAVRRRRELGRDVSESMLDRERRAGAIVLAARAVLERARSAYDGTLLLMKGLELAERYPNAILRPFRDLDLLADDPDRAQAAFIAAGFVPVGEDDDYYERRHHLRPLHLPGMPVLVEIHRHPQWVRWASGPAFDELASGAVPSLTGVEGLLAPRPTYHALLVASHSWSGAPLRRILDLVDVTLLAADSDETELLAAARRWDVERVWRTTVAAADAVLCGGKPLPWHVRLWAGDLFDVRERTVLSNHLRRIASAFSALPPRRAVPAAFAALGREVWRDADETWSEKLGRAARGVREPLRPISRRSRGRRDGQGSAGD